MLAGPRPAAARTCTRQISASDGQPEVIKVSTENLLADKRYGQKERRRERRRREITLYSSFSLSLSPLLFTFRRFSRRAALNITSIRIPAYTEYPINDLIYRFAYYNIAQDDVPVRCTAAFTCCKKPATPRAVTSLASDISS